jgi:hypothetical protein
MFLSVDPLFCVWLFRALLWERMLAAGCLPSRSQAEKQNNIRAKQQSLSPIQYTPDAGQLGQNI